MSYNKKITLLLIGILILGTLSGCSKFKQMKDTAIENIATESKLPQYNLDTETYDNDRYLIIGEELDIDSIGEPIGKVNYSCTIDENKVELSKDELLKVDVGGSKKKEARYKLTFGWIHEVKDMNQNEEIAININNLYYKCKLEKR